MKLIFVRHCEPDYSIDSLTEKGWKEAKCLNTRVKNWTNITAFYASPLGRAQATAQEALKGTDRQFETLDFMQEFYVRIQDPDTGSKRIPWDLMPEYWRKQPELFDKDLWTDTKIYQNTGLKEEFINICTNFDNLLSEYGYTKNDNIYKVNHDNDSTTLVFFCHLGVSFVVIGHLLGISPALLWHTFFVAPSSVTIVTSEERINNNVNFRVQTLGDTRHLYANGEPISSSGLFSDCFQK